jgi:UDP-N-acetylmuramoyl-L-alanyl-D-glutamate--2,6-diaminopimelate ligase
MRLSQVTYGAGVRGDLGKDPEVSGVTLDSRAVRQGTLFVAARGEKRDGHEFAKAAAQAGAAAVIAEREVDCAPAPLLLAADARRAAALCAANFHGRPGEKLTVLGVTGTNGKTTTTYLVEGCARAAGIPIGVLGTVSYRIAAKARPASHTTPESTELQALLAEMVAGGDRLAVLEVSSLAQSRADGIPFAAAAFTNLTRDHLDFHGTMEAYLAAKRRLFVELLREGGVAVVNADDPHGEALAAELSGMGKTVWTFSTRKAAALRASEVQLSLAGIRARVETPRGKLALESPLVGPHNLDNRLAAIGLALAAGLSLDAVARGLAACAGAPGRLERVEKNGVRAFVDYAHSDDALSRACAALRAVEPRRLVVVFGCGGDRDRGKRPLMGKAAGAAADLVVVTSDNPRTENPDAIIAEIVPGVEDAGLALLHPDDAREGARGYVIEADRGRAIRLALAAAKSGDAVLIAGKGHEDYQIVGTEKRHFDDREQARQALGL